MECTVIAVIQGLLLVLCNPQAEDKKEEPKQEQSQPMDKLKENQNARKWQI